MTIKRREFLKILSVILAVCTILVQTADIWVAGQASYTVEPVDNTVDPSVEFSPIDSIPHRTNNANMKSAPVLSSLGEGVRGSYAMQLGTMETFSNTVYFQPSGTSLIVNDTEYVIEMKIRKKQGNVDSLKIGFFGYNTTGANYSLELLDSELSSEWQSYTWKHTTKSSSGWKFLDITYTASSGAVLLFDDIKVYKSSDANKTPIAFQNGLSAYATFENTVVYEKNYEILGFDNSVDPNLEYTTIQTIPHRTNNTNMTVEPTLSALGEGIKGSYAMQIGNMETTKNSVLFQAANRTTIAHDTEYIIEMKVRVKQGSVKTFSVGIYENGSGSNNSLTVPNAVLTDKWQYFRWSHTTNSNSGNWKFFEISYNAPDGVILQIDDIKIYEASDESKTPIAFQNGLAAFATFENTITYEKNYEIVEFDNSVDPSLEYAAIETIPHRTNNTNMTVAPTLSELGEGVKGSYAIQIGNMETTANSIMFQPASRTTIAHSTEYVIELKVRVKEGSVKTFSVGIYENGNGSNNSLTIPTAVLTNEWQCIRWKHTTNSDDANWKFFEISYNAPDGVILQIDDIKIYEASDESKTLIAFQNGLAAFATFENTITYEKNYEIIEFDNSVDPNIEYTPIDNITHRENNENMISAPVLSELGEGVKGSYAMQIGNMETTSNSILFQPASRTTIAHSTEYIIELKVRVKEGSVKTFSAGIYENGSGSNNSLTVPTAVLTNEWQCIRWKHTTNSDDANWKFFEISYNAPDGVIIQIDDIKIYEASDESKTLIAFQNGLAANASFDNIFTYEQNYELVEFDNSVDPDVDYKAIDFIPHRTTNESMKYAPTVSAGGEGVKGSYAMQLGNMEIKSNSLRFQAASRTDITYDTEYVIEMKVRIKEGAVKTLSAGFYENSSGSDFSLTVQGNVLSDEWQCIRWRHTTNSDDANWKFFEISYYAPNGVIIQIDDIKIYEAMDPDKTLIAFQNGMDAEATFDSIRIPFETSKVDNTVDKDSKYVPGSFYDWNGDTNTSAINQFPSGYIFKNDARDTVRPRLSDSGEGVKGSYAMVVGGEGVKVTDQYQVRFSFPASNVLMSNTEYVFKVKLKKAQGEVDSFKIGFIESGNTAHYSLDILDSELSEEWTEYTWKYTTNDSCSGATVWNYVAVSYVASSDMGATVYIDDLVIYPAEYGESSPIFSMGSFDYEDLGQEKIEFTQTEPEDCEPVFRKSTAKDNNGGLEPRVVECNAHTGKYALALGFGETQTDSMYTVSLLPTKPGGTYRISFWVKVQGEVDSAYIGFMDSFQKYKYYGGNYSFNQYEQGKWTKIEFVYNDTATINTAKGYRYFMAKFSAPAGSGMLIDDVRITDVSLGEDAVNLLECGGFEKAVKELPSVTWSDRYIYKEEE